MISTVDRSLENAAGRDRRLLPELRVDHESTRRRFHEGDLRAAASGPLPTSGQTVAVRCEKGERVSGAPFADG